MNKVLIECIESCAGEWGSLTQGERREIDANIAESLVRGGLARYVVEDHPPSEVVVKKRPPKKSPKG